MKICLDSIGQPVIKPKGEEEITEVVLTTLLINKAWICNDQNYTNLIIKGIIIKGVICMEDKITTLITIITLEVAIINQCSTTTRAITIG